LKSNISKAFLLSLMMPCFFYSIAQPNWVLKKDKEGIQIFVASQPDSKFKALRVLCTIPASIEQLIAVLKEPQLQPNWVEATKQAYLVKTIANNQLIYYAEAALPWPISNRDMVIDLNFVQDPRTKILTINANTIEHILPEYNGKQRVPYSSAKWLVKAVEHDQISIDYTIKIDPGGGIPAWMVNLFIVKAPFESFKNLKKLIQEKRFQGMQYDVLKN
jgi:hypothetical protein